MQGVSDVLAAVIPLVAPAVIVGGIAWRLMSVIWQRFDKKLNEGRITAAATALDLKKANAEAAAGVATLLESHRVELMADVQEIKALAQATNGKVAEHDKQLTKHEAKIEVLLALATKGQPE